MKPQDLATITPVAEPSSSSGDMSNTTTLSSNSSNVQSSPSYENIYTQICTQIIIEQGRIIGLNLAIEQASLVQGLSINPENLHSTVTGDGSKVINDLITKYSEFFGHAAIEVCREAAARYLVSLPSEKTPTLLLKTK